MANEQQQAAHAAATETLKELEEKDPKFHFILLTMHEDGDVTTCSRRCHKMAQLTMLSNSINIEALKAAVLIASL